MLGDTAARDKDQVVSRWTSCEKHGSTRRPHNMLMVDQLWLWLIKSSDRNEPDTIISNFPSRRGINSKTRQVDDIQGTVLKKSADRSPMIDSGDVISRILDLCCRTLDRYQNFDTLEFLQSFETALEHAVSFHLCPSFC